MAFFQAARRHRVAVWAVALALLCPAGLSLAVPSKTSKPSAAATRSATVSKDATNALAEVEIPQSVFIIPANPKEGRNPFFPRSTTGVEAPKAKQTAAAVVDTSSIVLNGITPHPTPMVMLNGQTFEKGEEHEVKLPGGKKVMVKCEEIRADSAIILVNGTQRRELQLKSALK